MEFAHDVDVLVAEKLNAVLSIYKTEHFSLEHLSFVRNLLKGEDTKKGMDFDGIPSCWKQARNV